MFHIPRDNCKYIAIDVLDMEIQSVQQLVHDYGNQTDLFITSSKELEIQLNALGQRAVTIYHQQTNIYNQRIHGDNSRPVKTMSFMTGVSANLPSEKALEQIGYESCSVGVQFFTILYDSVNRKELGKNITGYGPCSDINSSDIHSPYKLITSQNHVEYPEQLYYQDIPFKVDIGILLLPASNQTFVHKPATRLLWWWSHGIPTIFYNYPSYKELAITYNYTLQGQIPVIHNIDEIGKHLRVLLDSPSERVELANIGISASSEFTPSKTSEKYFDLYESLR